MISTGTKVFGKYNVNYEQESATSTKVENTVLTYFDHIFQNRT